MRILQGLHRLSRILPLLLLPANLATASSRAYPLQIKVLSREFRSVGTPTPVPKDCDMQNFSAYCNESRNPTVQNVMVVQQADGQSFTIACTVDSRWSKCTPLEVGETFDARKDKNGFTILFRNAKGKEIKQLYQVLAAAPQPPLAKTNNSSSQHSSAAGQSPPPPGPAPAAPVPAPASTPALPVPQSPAPENPASPAASGAVHCRFVSTPSGAEITLDGNYVGSTPSVIDVGAGKHSVEFSLPGFGRWTRDLTVIAGSELTVSAILQKQQEQP